MIAKFCYQPENLVAKGQSQVAFAIAFATFASHNFEPCLVTIEDISMEMSDD